MSISSIITMVFVISFILGGFLLFAFIAVKKESDKQKNS